MDSPPPGRTFPAAPRPRPLPLPLPGTPSYRLTTLLTRLTAPFRTASPRICSAFFLLGLINNVLYVIILSAALDLVGPTLPKAIVLLADVVPSFFAKLLAPYFIHRVPYSTRVLALCIVSAAGMQMVAWGDGLGTRLAGVVLASLTSGLGELSFLALTSFYGEFAIPFWGSGTGAAGLLGAGMYVAATSWAGLSVRASLMAFGALPAVMLVAFFVVLPPLGARRHDYTPIRGDDDAEQGSVAKVHAAGGLHGFAARVRRTRALFWPYMLPLLIVYIGEYTINLGVSPTLLFPLHETPFGSFREFYPMYNTIYQLGVFISRSSTPFFRVARLYPPSLLQLANLLLLVSHALYYWIPNVYLVFAVVFWEGLLGGLVYVNTFEMVTERFEGEEREFSLGAVTVSDSAGICIAGFLSLGLEPWLCAWQVATGREWCRMT